MSDNRKGIGELSEGIEMCDDYSCSDGSESSAVCSSLFSGTLLLNAAVLMQPLIEKANCS